MYEKWQNCGESLEESPIFVSFKLKIFRFLADESTFSLSWVTTGHQGGWGKVMCEVGSRFWDWIEQMFLQGYTHPKEYIVTEWPLPSVVPDIWSLVYDHDCSGIVVLCHPDPSPVRVLFLFFSLFLILSCSLPLTSQSSNLEIFFFWSCHEASLLCSISATRACLHVLSMCHGAGAMHPHGFMCEKKIGSLSQFDFFVESW